MILIFHAFGRTLSVKFVEESDEDDGPVRPVGEGQTELADPSEVAYGRFQ